MRWKPIEGYLIPYRVSDTGIVQRFKYGEWIDCKSHFDARGKRMIVYLCKLDRTYENVTVSRLVYTHFVGKIPSGYSVKHKNGIKSDHFYANLEAVKNPAVGSKNRKKRPVEALKNGKVIRIYPSVSEAGNGEHMSRSNMWYWCNNQQGLICPLTGRSYRYLKEE